MHVISGYGYDKNIMILSVRPLSKLLRFTCEKKYNSLKHILSSTNTYWWFRHRIYCYAENNMSAPFSIWPFFYSIFTSNNDCNYMLTVQLRSTNWSKNYIIYMRSSCIRLFLHIIRYGNMYFFLQSNFIQPKWVVASQFMIQFDLVLCT